MDRINKVINEKQLLIEKLEKICPSCITEVRGRSGRINKAVSLKALEQLLSEYVADGSETYELTWVGKKLSMVEANRATNKTLRPCKNESINWNTTENLYIEGDNLETLKILQESYLGKVKLIYIDPPYNTGNDFIYKDDFAIKEEDFNEKQGLFDDDGNRLFRNNDSNGRFHSDWCSMIYSRLLLARDFLSDDGAIFISIDDNEIVNLKKICDDVFGEANFVNIISVKTKNIAGASGGGEDKRLKKNIEYILLYVKDYAEFSSFEKIYTKTEIGALLERYRHDGISWKYTSVLKDRGIKRYYTSTVDGDGNEIKVFKREGPVFKSISQIMNDEGLTETEVYYKYFEDIYTTAMPQSSIRTRVMKVVDDLNKDSLYSIEYVPKTGKNKGKIYEQFYKGDQLRLFAWLKDVAQKDNSNVYKLDALGTLWDGINLNNLTKEGDIAFENGKKPLELLTNILKMIKDNDYTVMDFFSGSATTAHAVMQLNTEDGGNRRFIMVQLPEKCDEKSEAYKAGYKTICDIGKERIRRAAKKIHEEHPDAKFDDGFRVFKVDSSNMNDINYSASDMTQDLLSQTTSNIKADRTDLDLLFDCLLKEGVEITYPYSSEVIDGCTVHDYNDGALMACFDEDVTEAVMREMAKRNPIRAIFRDSSFKTDADRINVEEIFKLLSPDTTVKVI